MLIGVVHLAVPVYATGTTILKVIAPTSVTPRSSFIVYLEVMYDIQQPPTIQFVEVEIRDLSHHLLPAKVNSEVCAEYGITYSKSMCSFGPLVYPIPPGSFPSSGTMGINFRF
jgi:hypothetical protein